MAQINEVARASRPHIRRKMHVPTTKHLKGGSGHHWKVR